MKNSSAAKPAAYSWAELSELWNQFWFRPADVRPLAAVRIATGVALLAYVFSWGNASNWLGSDGPLRVGATAKVLDTNPFESEPIVFRGLILFGDSPSVVVALQVFLGIAAVLLAAGCLTRIVAPIAWLLFLWFAHRATLVSGASEPVIAALLFYLVWSPCQRAWSVDHWWLQRKKPGKSWTSRIDAYLPPLIVANIALRLLQIHVAFLVFSMAEVKLANQVWWDGDAVYYLTANTLSRPVDLTILRKSPIVVDVWTHAIFLTELLFPILIWFPLFRRGLLCVAAAVWLSLPLLTGEWLFPLAMAGALLAFVPATWWERKWWERKEEST